MGRSVEILQKQADKLENSQVIELDVSKAASVKTGFETARASNGPIDVLVNNAGAALSAPLYHTTDEDWHQMLGVNLTGTFYCCREVISDMKKNHWGRIVNIASIAGLAGAPYITAYTAAKHGVIGLTRSLALELARDNVTVNAICPGYVNTDMLERSITNIMDKTTLDRDQVIEELLSKNPQHRFIEPEEVAATVLWLCQASCDGITGEAISMNGGGTGA